MAENTEKTTKKTGADKDFNYTASRDTLQKIVAELESGNLEIEKALELWSQADILAKKCQEFLEQAKQKISLDTD